jgi:ketosteroid isomerase-like protein
MTDATTRSTLEVMERFNDAFNSHDVDRVMALMTDDVVFESTSPPDGARHEGAATVRTAWEAFFSSSPDARFETEEMLAVGDRCVQTWVYRYTEDGEERHVRGVDVLRVRDGKVAEKLSYVKG